MLEQAASLSGQSIDHFAVTDCRFENTDQEALHISHGGGRDKLNAGREADGDRLPLGNLAHCAHPVKGHRFAPPTRSGSGSPESSRSIAAATLTRTSSSVMRSSTSWKKPKTMSRPASSWGMPRLIR